METVKSAQAELFQSTLPRRERRGLCDAGEYVVYFNPRSREGSDGWMKTDTRTTAISIHAPAKGATGIWCDFEYDTEISIHAPAKGATVTRNKIV